MTDVSSFRYDIVTYMNKVRVTYHAHGAVGVLTATRRLLERKLRKKIAPKPNAFSAAPTRISEYLGQIFNIAKKTQGISTEYVPKMEEFIDASAAPVKIIAFYLPQFHPFKENDKWWGQGFTEWTNVSKAMPQYVGHYQPRLPGEMGFYDLRLVDVMRQQAKLARQYGVSGFCFHHYWFGGKRLMERPVDQFLAQKDIDISFCLCWANENWTRRWDGQEEDVLIAQSYSATDDLDFLDNILPYLKDSRYLRFDGKPVLIVYRVSQLPDAKATAERWRQRSKEAGLGDLYLIAARSFEITDPRPYGFDAAIEFPPHQIPASRINDQMDIVNPDYRGNIYSFQEIAAGYANQTVDGYPLIKTVFPSWDNEARRPGAGHTFHGASPLNYANWLDKVYSDTVAKVSASTGQPPFVFVNAWNEWAEGAYLEPDRKYGYAYLHATGNIVREYMKTSDEVAAVILESQEAYRKNSDCALVLHIHYEDLIDEIATYAGQTGIDVFISLRRNVSLEACQKLKSIFPSARLEMFANRGRDVFPFLETLKFIRSAGYETACKLHTKKSLQRQDGGRLRNSAFENLLGSTQAIDAIRQRFVDEPRLGILAPTGSILPLGVHDRNILNRDWLDRLLFDLGMPDLVGNYHCSFIAGTMFWFRVDALASFDKLHLPVETFDSELGQVDGTLAHALERLFAVAAENSGYAVEETGRS